ncbi:hypothetical protein RhiTH_003997 [Rhizoctonia solani]
MLGLKLVALLVAFITLVIASPTPTHNHKDCDRNYFWWGRKSRCLPYGGIRGVIVPPKHHCGRWYWHTNLGYCVPPQPDWSDPQCPAGWRWDDGAYSCLPSAPSFPDSGYGTGGVSIGQCGPSYFWWGPRSFCLAIGGPSVLPAVPNGWACPSNWYWHGNGDWMWDRPPWSVWTWRFTKSRILPNLKGLTGIWEYSLPLVLLPGSQIPSEANLITGRFITSLIARDILFDFKPVRKTTLHFKYQYPLEVCSQVNKHLSLYPIAQLSAIPLNVSDARVATADIQITLNPEHAQYRLRVDSQSSPYYLRGDACNFIEDYRSGTVLDFIGPVGGLFALLEAAHLLLFGRPLFWGLVGAKTISPFGLLGRCSSQNFKSRLREEYHMHSDEESAHTIQIVKFLRDFVIDFGPADLDPVAHRPRESSASSFKAESDEGDENEPDSEM